MFTKYIFIFIIQQITSIENLYMVQTVDSKKIANALDRSMQEKNKILNVLIQINTSKETGKIIIIFKSYMAIFKYSLL